MPADPGAQAGPGEVLEPIPPIPPPLPPELVTPPEPVPPPLPPLPPPLPPPAPPAAAEPQAPEPAEAEPAYVTQDGDQRHRVEPVFDVGDYHFQAAGYVQGQYQNDQRSENQLSPDGARLLNQTGFSVPRARIVVEGANKWSGAVLEYDLANVNSQFSGVQRAEATLHWRNPKSNVPYLAVTLGIFRTPFGAEAPLSARLRYYAENATITRALFPGQSDVGFRAEGGVAWFRYALAFVNGHPILEPRWGGLAPTKQGDAVGRLGVDAELGAVRLIGGASLLKGHGFSPGNPATKDTVAVRDVSETGTVSAGSVVLVPARAATESQRFNRWATGVDLELDANVADVWQFRVRGEFIFAQNLDRSLFISDPIALGYDARGYGAVGSFDNVLWQLGLLGFRYDFYQPNPDSTTRVGGDVVKTSQSITTYTCLAGLQLPGTNTRVFFEYDLIKDHLALGSDGRPADLKNNRFLTRLQVSLW